MGRTSLLLLFLLTELSVTAQNTYYYKLTKKVKDDVTTTNVSGGQFISFTDKACYESDKNGYSVQHGRLDYKYTDNGIKAYVGDSYWGSHTVFLFRNDLSVLNVKTSNGDIYVYKRMAAPAGITTCSLIRKKSEGGGTYVPPIYPVYPFQPVYPVSGNNSSNGTSSGNRNNTTTRQQPTKHTCSLCNGKKRIPHEANAPQFGLDNNYKITCQECGQQFPRSWGHSHITCPQCHGRGYFTTD